MRQTVDFYTAASRDAIPGYKKLIENHFGIVFRRELP